MEFRIPFAECIKDKRLMKDRWDSLSDPQKVALKTFYGLPLDENELRIYTAQQGGAEFDDLGYVKDIKEIYSYKPKKFSEAWAVVGRRGGKTDKFASTIVAYEACFGGHEEFVTRGQKAYIFQVAQDLRNAQHALHFIFAAIEESPVGKALLDGPPVRDEIRLKNNIIIKCVPCTLKAVRGFACPVAVFDEVGVWYQESDSANPDYEIYRAIKPAQIQFPNRLLVGISSPYNKQGLLYKYFEAGTDGKNAPKNEKNQFRNIVVIHSPTAAMGNSLVTRESLEEERDRDVKAFERECLAIFQDSISGFLDGKLLREATDIGIEEREPLPDRYSYVASIDPAFKHDAFGFTVFHLDEEGDVVQDCVRRYKPPAGKALNPEAIFADIEPILKSYGVVVIYSDQYHLESLQQLAMRYGFIIEGVPFKATNKSTIYGSMQQLLNQHRLHLLDHKECLKELRQLEKKLTQTGVVQISAPHGNYDDLAAVTAICCYKCLWMAPKPQEAPIKEPTVFDRVQEQIKRRKVMDQLTPWD